MKISKIIRKGSSATVVVVDTGKVVVREFPASMSDAEIAAAVTDASPVAKKAAKSKGRKNA